MNMNKKEFLEELFSELNRMEKDHISEFAEKGDYDKVDEIVEKVDYDFLQEYLLNEDFENIYAADIPEEYRLTFAFFIYGARNISVPDYEDDLDLYLVYDLEKLIDQIADREGISSIIGGTMRYSSMREYKSFAELVEDYNR